MKVLSIDTATESATCAILDENKLYGEIILNYKKQHSVILMSSIDTLLKNLNLSLNDLDAFIVSDGPGSFTGLRIGAATVKGICQGLNKPFVAISSLDALAYNLAYSSGIICPILDALRDNVYTALYHFEGENLIRTTEYLAISIDELIELLKKESLPVTFIGDATLKFKDKLQSSIKDSYFAPANLNLSRASSLGEIGIKELLKNKNDDVFTYSPHYLKKSQAEREYEEKHGKSIE